MKLDIYCNAHCINEEIEAQIIVLTFSLNREEILALKERVCPWSQSRLGGLIQD